MNDQELEDSALKLANLRSQMEELGLDYDQTFDQVIAALKARGERKLLFMTAEGPKAVGYTEQTRGDAIDVAALEKALTHEEWLAVTRPARVFDQEKLAQALRNRIVSQAKVNRCVIPGKHITARMGPRPATNNEAKELMQTQESAR